MPEAARLPGAPDAADRVICHVDMDCFYAACERLREPALRDEPVVVGMGFEPGETTGVVATASYEARAYGVESAQPISEALAALPRKIDAADDPEMSVAEAGYYRPVDMAYYQSVADDVRAILREHADVLREVSIDEAYLDVTDRVSWEEDEPAAFARQLKRAIAASVDVRASVGVAPNKSAAKIASDHDKPDGLVVVRPGTVREFLAPLDVEAVHGIGPVTASELRGMGIETAGELAAADRGPLEARFGDRGLAVRRYARGEDDRPVEPTGDPKSLSRQAAFDEATSEHERQRNRIQTLAGAVAERAASKGALYRTIGIRVIQPPFDVYTRERTLPGPVDDPALVEEIAVDLLAEFLGEPARKLGVRVSNLSFTEEEQVSLETWDEAVDTTDQSAGPAPRRGQVSLDDFGEDP